MKLIKVAKPGQMSPSSRGLLKMVPEPYHKAWTNSDIAEILLTLRRCGGGGYAKSLGRVGF